MNKNNNPTLPIELIREILLRLPVRSVLRFKCVCKSWLCVINDPQFGFSHYDLDATPSHRLLLRSTRFYIETLDIETSLENYGGGVHVLIPPPPPPPLGTYDSYGYSRLDSLMIYPRDGRVILGSCRGLVALYYTGSNDLVIWNPSTGLHKSLPQFGDRIATDDYLYGFGYDPSTDDYLITLIKLDDKYGNADDKVQIQIFSLKTGWFSFMKVKALYMDCGCRLRSATLFNDTLHWCVFSVDKRQSVIIAFDLKRRSLSEIPLFDHFTVEEYIIYSLRVMGAHLSVCCWVHRCPTIEIWMMKEYKVQSSWSVYIVLPTYGGERFSPICFTKDGQIFGSNTRQRLEKINDKGDKVDFFRYGIGAEVNQVNLQSAMYRESLLPLPSVCKKLR